MSWFTKREASGVFIPQIEILRSASLPGVNEVMGLLKHPLPDKLLTHYLVRA